MEIIDSKAGDTFQNRPAFLFFLLLFVFGGALLGSLFISLIGGSQLQTWVNDPEYMAGLTERNTLRLVQLAGHLFTFTFPALAFAIVFFRRQWAAALRLDQLPAAKNILTGALFLLLSFPLAQWLLWLNSQLPLPEWADNMETSTTALLQQLLKMEQPSELLFNLLLIGLAPALGEELLFRGILQQYLQKLNLKPWIAIWATAILFSLFHFQLAGFLARMLLGACLGYLLYWTNNLWVPIVAHLAINGMQVLLPWFNPEMIELAATENTDPPNWAITITSTIFMLMIAGRMSRTAGETNEV